MLLRPTHHRLNIWVFISLWPLGIPVANQALAARRPACMISGWTGVLTQSGCHSKAYAEAYSRCSDKPKVNGLSLIPCNPLVFGEGVCAPKAADDRWTYSCLKTAVESANELDLKRQNQVQNEVLRNTVSVEASLEASMTRNARLQKQSEWISEQIFGIASRRGKIKALEADVAALDKKSGFLRSSKIKEERASNLAQLKSELKLQKEMLDEDYEVLAVTANTLPGENPVNRQTVAVDKERVPREVLEAWVKKAREMKLTYEKEWNETGNTEDERKKFEAVVERDFAPKQKALFELFKAQSAATIDADVKKLAESEREKFRVVSGNQEVLNALNALKVDERFLFGSSDLDAAEMTRREALRELVKSNPEGVAELGNLCAQLTHAQDKTDCLGVYGFLSGEPVAKKANSLSDIESCIPEDTFDFQKTAEELNSNMLEVEAFENRDILLKH